MKRVFVSLVSCCAVLLLYVPGFAQISVSWQELKSEHFIVNFNPKTQNISETSVDDRFARQVLDKAEYYYTKIADNLGYPRASGFWTWEKRGRIYIYPDKESYLAGSQQKSWSEGMADYSTKTIHSYAGSRHFLDSILPHELAHLIFRDFVGFKGEIPLWLDEGVAQWQETGDSQAFEHYLRALYEKDSLLSLSDMMKLDIRRLNIKNDGLYIRSIKTRSGERGVLFLTGENLISTYYAQSASLVEFLVEKFGTADFAQFCRQLRDGASLEQAIVSVYILHMKTLDEFEDRWRMWLAEKYGG